jgi:AAA family ATP:ADP antiporter
LDLELKTKGKPAVEVVGGRLGKAGGAFVQTLLLSAYATKDVVAIAPVAFGIFAFICVLWFFAVKFLGYRVVKAQSQESMKAA